MKKKATIKDVAKMANVSTATVSRVLNNNYPVSEEVMEKVLSAMNELEYKPSSIARSLRINKSNLVAIVVADIRNPYYASIAREIDNILFHEGYNLILCSTDESPDKERKVLDLLIKKNVDAVAISPCVKDTTNIMELLQEDIYTILIDRKIPSLHLPFIGGNNFEDSYLLTEHLIKKGHRQIAIMVGSLDNSTGEERFNGYKKALENYQLPYNEGLVLSGDFIEDKAFASMDQFFSTQDSKEPIAIVSCNNLMTEGIMKAAKKHNKRIPEDLSLVSFGEIESQELIVPKVTCIKQNVKSIGKHVAKMISDQLNGMENTNKEYIIENIFIEGTSVKEMAT